MNKETILDYINAIVTLNNSCPTTLSQSINLLLSEIGKELKESD